MSDLRAVSWPRISLERNGELSAGSDGSKGIIQLLVFSYQLSATSNQFLADG